MDELTIEVESTGARSEWEKTWVVVVRVHDTARRRCVVIVLNGRHPHASASGLRASFVTKDECPQ